MELINEAVRSGVVWRGVPATIKAWTVPDECIVRSDATHDKAMWLRSVLFNNSLAKAICTASDPGQKVVRATLKSGLRLQCRLDFWLGARGIAGDLKTSNVGPDSFLKKAITYGYDVQSWLYTQLCLAAGLEVSQRFVFVVQQTVYPFASYVIELPEEMDNWIAAKTLNAIMDIETLEPLQSQTSAIVPHMPLWMLHLIEEGA